MSKAIIIPCKNKLITHHKLKFSIIKLHLQIIGVLYHMVKQTKIIIYLIIYNLINSCQGWKLTLQYHQIVC